MIEINYLPAMLAVVLAAALSAAVSYWHRRDIFDPRVSVAIGFAYFTLGPSFYCMVTGDPPNPGLKIKHLDTVHLLIASSIIGLFLGSSLVLRKTATSRLRPRSQSPVDRLTSQLVLMILFVGISAGLASYAYAGFIMHGGNSTEGKSIWLTNATEAQSRIYYLSAGMVLLGSMFFVVLDSVSRDRGIPWPSLAVILLHTIVCIYNSEREFVLVGLVLIGVNWSTIPRSYLALGGMCLSLLMVWIAATRNAGQTAEDGLAAFLSGELPRTLLASVTHLSPNVHVLTNVMDVVPHDEPYWKGRSLLLAVLCLIPGDYAFKKETPMLWFQRVYDRQGESGYAFSLDSEAYLNFGLAGPGVFFFLLGIILAMVYNRACRSAAKPIDVYIWWYVLAMSMFAIRSDSRGFLKMVLFGSMLACALWGTVNAYVKRQAGARVRPRSAGGYQ